MTSALIIIMSLHLSKCLDWVSCLIHTEGTEERKEEGGKEGRRKGMREGGTAGH